MQRGRSAAVRLGRVCGTVLSVPAKPARLPILDRYNFGTEIRAGRPEPGNGIDQLGALGRRPRQAAATGPPGLPAHRA